MNLVRDEAVVEVNKDEKAAKPAKTTKSTKADDCLLYTSRCV